MPATQYNTLSMPAPEPRKAPMMAKLVAVVGVACCAMFMAGRVHMTPTAYTHEEVLNLGAICAEGEYIGECVTCQECADYEYVNGGCTFFKDTFCSYCEPIDNCQRENHACTTRIDQTCTTCDCNDPIQSWDDISKEAFAVTHKADQTSFSCYLGAQCDACTPCKNGFYETNACDQRTQTDTTCQRCTACEAGEFVAEPCTYFTDTVCVACAECEFEKTTDEQCTGHPDRYSADDAVHVEGQDTKCRACNQCDNDMEFVEGICTPSDDTDCTVCKECDDGEYIVSDCEASDGPTIFGANKVCAECAELVDPAEEPVFLTAVCDPMEHTDFVYDNCVQCVYGEYEESNCFFGGQYSVGTDRVCQPCAPIDGCPPEFVQCSNNGDATCSRCKEDGQFGDFGDAEHWDAWKTCCDDGALGKTCGWDKLDNGCNEDGSSFRERSARRGGFDMSGTASDFVLWCATLCGSFEECTGFEVEDCIAANECDVAANTICGLKNIVPSADFEFGSGSESLTCWTKPVDFESGDLDYISTGNL